MAIMDNDRRSFGTREQDEESGGRNDRRGGYDRASYDRYGDGSDRRFGRYGSDYGGPHHGEAGGGRNRMSQEDRWHGAGRDHDERRGGGGWYGGRDDDDRGRSEYGGGQYGMGHYGNHPHGGRHRGGYGDDEGYGGGSRQRERDFDREIGVQRGGGRGWYGGEQEYGEEHSGGGASGGYPQRDDAMRMGAGLGRGSGMTGKGPKGYTRSDDRIKEDVCDCLTDDHHVDASSIEVQVKSGEVTLSGTVDSREAKRRAEDLVERASGVKHVQNNLRVQPGSDTGGSDATKRTGAGHTTSSIIT